MPRLRPRWRPLFYWTACLLYKHPCKGSPEQKLSVSLLTRKAGDHGELS